MNDYELNSLIQETQKRANFLVSRVPHGQVIDPNMVREHLLAINRTLERLARAVLEARKTSHPVTEDKV